MSLFLFNLTQARNKIGGWLAANAAIAAWCQAKYGKAPKVICGIELLDQAGEADAPFIRFDIGNRSGGQVSGEHGLELIFQLGIVNQETERQPVTDAGTGGTFEVLPGVAEMMDLIELVTQELDKSLSSTVDIADADSAADIVVSKPLYTGLISFNLTAPNAMGRVQQAI